MMNEKDEIISKIAKQVAKLIFRERTKKFYNSRQMNYLLNFNNDQKKI